MGSGEARGRRCARPGCRAWAVRGTAYCRWHQGDAGIVGERSAGHAVRSAFSDGRRDNVLGPLIEERLADVLATLSGRGDTGDLLDEAIAALRVVLAKVLAEEEDAGRLATSIPRIVDSVVRAVRARRAVSGAVAEDLTEALTQILIELGVGEA